MFVGRITSLDYISQLPKSNAVTSAVTVVFKDKQTRVIATLYIPNKRFKNNKEAIEFLERIFPCVEWD